MTEIAVEGVSKRFGGLQALSGVSFPLRTGEVRAVIGSNGAGKFGKGLVDAGITRTFQNVRLFGSLTVLEHLMLARSSYERSRRFRPGAGVELPLIATLGCGLMLRNVVALLFGNKAMVFPAITLRLHHWFFAIATLTLSIAAVSAVGRLDIIGGPLGLSGIPLVSSPWPPVLALIACFGAAAFNDRRVASLPGKAAEGVMTFFPFDVQDGRPLVRNFVAQH